jgi:hypothetical protein
MPRSRTKGDNRKIRVVAQRREAIDTSVLAVALFSWVMDKVRAEQVPHPEQQRTQPQESDDGGDR